MLKKFAVQNRDFWASGKKILKKIPVLDNFGYWFQTAKIFNILEKKNLDTPSVYPSKRLYSKVEYCKIAEYWIQLYDCRRFYTIMLFRKEKHYWNTEEILNFCFSTLHILRGSSKDQV